MARGGKIQIDFMAKATDKVSATMKKVNGSVKGAGKEAGAAAGKMGKLNIAMAAIAAAAVVAGKKLLDLANETAAYGDAVTKQSAGLGLTVEQYQELDHALSLSGLSMKENANAFAKLGRTIRDAAEGSAEAQKKMSRMGVTATDNEGQIRSVHSVFLDLTDAFAGMSTQTEKTAASLDFFEESGFKLIPLLEQGSDGIRAMAQDARDLRRGYERTSGEGGRVLQGQRYPVRTLSLDGVKRTIGTAVMPVIESLPMRSPALCGFGVSLGRYPPKKQTGSEHATERNLVAGRKTTALTRF